MLIAKHNVVVILDDTTTKKKLDTIAKYPVRGGVVNSIKIDLSKHNLKGY